MQGIAAGLLDRRDHAWMVVSNRGTDLARGEVEHSLAIPRLHERSRRPAHHIVDELAAVPDQETGALIHGPQATAPVLRRSAAALIARPRPTLTRFAAPTLCRTTLLRLKPALDIFGTDSGLIFQWAPSKRLDLRGERSVGG